MSTNEDPITKTIKITLHRTDLIPNGGGARIGFSDDYPDKQFLILPDVRDLMEIPSEMMHDD